VSGYAETNQREKFAEIMRKHWTEHPDYHDDQTKHVAKGIDFLYHKNGAGWNQQKEGSVDWLNHIRLIREAFIPKEAISSRATLKIYPNSGREIKVNVEVVQDTESISQGLMNRPMLPQMAGMVFQFPYPPSYTGFWMKNMMIPLSIAFWDKNGRIIEIKDMEPCRPGSQCPVYRCIQPYWGAVEVNKGFFQRWGIRPGDRVVLEG
jgi:uncharacterized membrane protein (UPF0127 family)